MALSGRNSFEQSQNLAVPWEQNLSPEKRRYDVCYIRRGGMGIVYLAYDRELDGSVAIKTLYNCC